MERRSAWFSLNVKSPVLWLGKRQKGVNKLVPTHFMEHCRKPGNEAHVPASSMLHNIKTGTGLPHSTTVLPFGQANFFIAVEFAISADLSALKRRYSLSLRVFQMVQQDIIITYVGVNKGDSSDFFYSAAVPRSELKAVSPKGSFTHVLFSIDWGLQSAGDLEAAEKWENDFVGPTGVD